VLSSVNSPLDVGDRMTFPGAPGDPTLTVVGLASSIGQSADAWVSPAELAALTAPGSDPSSQMLYRFASGGTDAEIAADRAQIAAAVPQGSMTGAASYLKVKLAADKSSATYVPFVTAFGVLGLVMSILIIGIVVSGAVAAGTRRIGILKALGFTPAQVVRAYVAQALLPAATGTLLGVLLGNLLAIPVMGTAGTAFGTGTETVAPWIDFAVPGVALFAVAATALAPALRAGRLRTVEAISVARTPRAGRGRVVRQFAGRLPLPRSVSLGLANPFSQPARSATMIAAVILGTVGVSFGVGLGISLNEVQDGLNRQNAGSVIVQPFGPPAPPAPGMPQVTAQANAADVVSKISAQPGTGSYFSTGQTQLSVAGLAGSTEVIAYQGDYSWGAYQMVSGSWFTGPGQVVAPAAFLTATGTHVGSTITLANGGHSATAKIVGQIFTLHQVILTDSATLNGLGAYIVPESVQYDIELKPGVSQGGYIASLDTALASYGVTAQSNTAGLSTTVIAMDTLAAILTLMLVAVGGLGILNTVVLDTRERVHDIGVLKALGMSPRQTVSMVLTSVSLIGLLAGAIGVPIGIALHDYVLPAMGNAAGTTIPAVDMAAYSLPVLIPLVLGGLVIATAGALLPAGWAARTRTATALRTE
jgi:putative ABC transport system permease protein